MSIPRPFSAPSAFRPNALTRTLGQFGFSSTETTASSTIRVPGLCFAKEREAEHNQKSGAIPSAYTPETKQAIITLWRDTLPDLYDERELATMNLEGPIRLLQERALTTNHFDPYFWLLAAWLAPRDTRLDPVASMQRGIALLHGQDQALIPLSPTEAIELIGLNINRQVIAMDAGRWAFQDSRDLITGQGAARREVRDTLEVLRLRGLWFDRIRHLEHIRNYQWGIVSLLPEMSLFNLLVQGTPTVSILPGPLPPHLIYTEGRMTSIVREMKDYFRSFARVADHLERIDLFKR